MAFPGHGVEVCGFGSRGGDDELRICGLIGQSHRFGRIMSECMGRLLFGTDARKTRTS